MAITLSLRSFLFAFSFVSAIVVGIQYVYLRMADGEGDADSSAKTMDLDVSCWTPAHFLPSHDVYSVKICKNNLARAVRGESGEDVGAIALHQLQDGGNDNYTVLDTLQEASQQYRQSLASAENQHNRKMQLMLNTGYLVSAMLMSMFLFIGLYMVFSKLVSCKYSMLINEQSSGHIDIKSDDGLKSDEPMINKAYSSNLHGKHSLSLFYLSFLILMSVFWITLASFGYYLTSSENNMNQQTGLKLSAEEVSTVSNSTGLVDVEFLCSFKIRIQSQSHLYSVQCAWHLASVDSSPRHRSLTTQLNVVCMEVVFFAVTAGILSLMLILQVFLVIPYRLHRSLETNGLKTPYCTLVWSDLNVLAREGQLVSVSLNLNRLADDVEK